jgi:ubiquinone/menaquinone biosynthesis C-methylase UbiE
MKEKKIKAILKENEKSWEEIADKFSQTRGNFWPEFKDWSKYIKKGDRVLDLACGNGRLNLFLKEKGIDYLGVDQSKNLIYQAQKKFPQDRFLNANALDLPFTKKQFEIIFAIAFLHHLPSQELKMKLLKDCFRFLNKKGYLILTVWNLYQPRLIKKYQIGKILFGFKNVIIPFKYNHQEVPRYYYAFTKGELKNMVKKAGFCLKEIYYTRQGQKTNWRQGYNLVVIAQK